MYAAWAKKQTAFTLVELLIVIIVIAILAAISIVAYNGIQERARDSQRTNDIAAIAKALEMYYLHHGRYPGISNGAVATINGGWSTTADSSWQRLSDALESYATGIGRDPVSTPGANVQDSGYNYCLLFKQQRRLLWHSRKPNVSATVPI